MAILIIDDEEDIRALLVKHLKKAGYADIVSVDSAKKGFKCMGIDEDSTKSVSKNNGFDLILIDVAMPQIDGIEACSRILSYDHLKDIPIIMISSMKETKLLDIAFKSGAIDYITKPIDKVDLLARTRSALRIKKRIDAGKKKTAKLQRRVDKLEKENKTFEEQSFIDSVTGAASRYQFNDYFRRECKRASRAKEPLSFLLAEIDSFKNLLDTFGSQAEGDILKKVIHCINKNLKRPGDFVACYDRTKLAILLTNSSKKGALQIAKTLRSSVEKIKISKPKSNISSRVTISMGVTSIEPGDHPVPYKLFSAADKALTKAQNEGVNSVIYKTSSPLKRAPKFTVSE
ncbi:MAG: diguanylate cyclase [Proteobacteria bacterium]|nr:diguanylate cyclase [Pseudomonadota bacterium]